MKENATKLTVKMTFNLFNAQWQSAAFLNPQAQMPPKVYKRKLHFQFKITLLKSNNKSPSETLGSGFN